MSEGFAPLLEFLQNPYAWAALGTATALLGGYYLITKSSSGSGYTGEGGGFNWFGWFGGNCGSCPIHAAGKPAGIIHALPAPPLAIPVPAPAHGKCSI